MTDQHRRWHYRLLGVGSPLGDARRWDQADWITYFEAVYGVAHGFDKTGCFITQSAGKRRLFKVLAAPEHRFSAVETDGFHADADLIGAWLGDRQVLYP
jgi:hypothetical protein